MINYRIRPAILSKSILEFCKANKTLIGNRFYFILDLEDSEPVSMKLVTRLLEEVEEETNENYFYSDLFKHFSSRLIAFFSPLMLTTTPTERLKEFTLLYQGSMANIGWELYESKSVTTLVANRGNKAACSKYDDIFILLLISNIIYGKDYKSDGNLEIKLPFEREFYKPFLSMFKSASFSNDTLSISIKSDRAKTNTTDHSTSNIKDISIKKKTIAAANMTPVNELDLTSLAFNLSMSKRNLQRELRTHGLSG